MVDFNKALIQSIEKALRAASKGYYSDGKSDLSDDEFDKELAKLRKRDPSNSFLSEVGSSVAFRDKVKLPVKMGSLNKLRPAEVVAWIDSIKGNVSNKRDKFRGFVITPKLDGVSLLLHYKEGFLKSAFTRGDGKEGQDVTEHAKHLFSVMPERCNYSLGPHNKRGEIRFGLRGNVYVSGEVIIHTSLFERVKKLAKKKGDKEYNNARNFVAGQINSKIPNPSYLRKMTFVAFNIQGNKVHGLTEIETKADILSLLSQMGFVTPDFLSRSLTHSEQRKANTMNTNPPESNSSEESDFIKYMRRTNSAYGNNNTKIVIDDKEVKDCPTITPDMEGLANIGKLFKSLERIPVLTDGLVIELNSLGNRKHYGLESNGLNPSWARAIKPSHDQHVTKKGVVEKVEWNISKRGVYKPVAVLKSPLDFDGVKVQRMTLHNALFVKKKRVRTNAKLNVIRSGDVIPYVKDVFPVKSKKTGKKLKGSYPVDCNHCDSKLEWTDTDLYCPNKQCVGKLSANAVSFFSLIGVDGVAGGVIEQLQSAGYTTIPELIQCDVDSIQTLEGFGKRKAKKVSEGLNNCCIGVRFADLAHASGCFSTEKASLGSRRLSSMETELGLKRVMSGKINKKMRADLIEIEGVSDTSATIFLEGLPTFRSFVASIDPEYVSVKKKLKPKSSALVGMNFCFTGFRNRDAELLIINHGGEVKGSVSKATTVLFCKADSGTKYGKATKLGVDTVLKDDHMSWLENKVAG